MSAVTSLELTRQVNRYDWVTSVYIPGLDADFVPHVGKRIAVVVDGSTPQVTMLAMCLRDVEHEGWSLTLASAIVVPTFPPPARFSVLNERWETIGTQDSQPDSSAHSRH